MFTPSMKVGFTWMAEEPVSPGNDYFIANTWLMSAISLCNLKTMPGDVVGQTFKSCDHMPASDWLVAIGAWKLHGDYVYKQLDHM